MQPEPLTTLSLEKQFNHAQFCQDVQHLSHQQATTLLIQLHHLMLSREQVFSDMLRQQLGIERQQFGGDRNNTGGQ